MTRTGNLMAIAALLLVVICAACSKDDRQPCTQPQTVNVRANCYTYRDTVRIDSVLPGITLIPLNAEKAVAFRAGRTSVFTMTLSPNSDSARWVIQPDSNNATLRDTLTMRYQRRLEFISNACGYTYYYKLDTAYSTGPTIDSVRITNPDITNDANVQHLRLYY